MKGRNRVRVRCVGISQEVGCTIEWEAEKRMLAVCGRWSGVWVKGWKSNVPSCRCFSHVSLQDVVKGSICSRQLVDQNGAVCNGVG